MVESVWKGFYLIGVNKVRCLIAGIMVDKGVWLGMEYGLLGGVLVMELGCSKGGGGCHGKWSLTAFDKKAGDHGLHGLRCEGNLEVKGRVIRENWGFGRARLRQGLGWCMGRRQVRHQWQER